MNINQCLRVGLYINRRIGTRGTSRIQTGKCIALLSFSSPFAPLPTSFSGYDKRMCNLISLMRNYSSIYSFIWTMLQGDPFRYFACCAYEYCKTFSDILCMSVFLYQSTP